MCQEYKMFSNIVVSANKKKISCLQEIYCLKASISSDPFITQESPKVHRIFPFLMAVRTKLGIFFGVSPRHCL